MPSKAKVEIEDAVAQAMQALGAGGILLTTKGGSKVDSMVIGWGTFGINWGKPVAVVYVRKGRDTRGNLDRTMEFTLNIPDDRLTPQIVMTCGTTHRHDINKAKELGFTLVDSDIVRAPGIAQVPLTIECKVIYRQKEKLGLYPDKIQKKYYPQDVDSDATGSNRDVHIAYYGEIVNAYRIEP